MASVVERESLFCDSQFSKTAFNAFSVQRQSALFCDVIMRICGKELYAHSNILAAASPYFSVFLSQDSPRQFSQRSPQVIEIEIEGSSPSQQYEEALESIIDYVYTGKLRIKSSTAFQVIEIARIMQMNNIVIFCEAFLQGKIPGTSGTVVTPPGVYLHASTNTEESWGKSKFFTNKFVSVSTLVTPQLLGLKSIKNEVKDSKTQTTEKDFDQLVLTKRPRGRPRKRPRENETEEILDKFSDREVAEEEEPELETDADGVTDDRIPDDDGIEEYVDEGNEKKMDSAATILENKEEVTDTVTESENDSPVKSFKIKSRRSGRMIKPTYKLQEASRNMLVVEPQKDDDYHASGDDDDDVLITSMKSPKRRRGRPARVRGGSSPSKKLIRAETLISKLTEKDKNNSNVEGPNDEAERTSADNDADETVNDQDEDYGNSPMVCPKQEESDDEKESESNTEVPTRMMATRSGRLCRTIPASQVLKKKKGPHKFECKIPDCYFVTNSVREMSNHQKLHKLEQNVCYYCENQYDNTKDLIAHLEKHKGPNPFFCPACDLRFKSRTQLTLHLPKHSQDKPYKCELCDARFKWKHAVKNHMVTHSKKKDLLCDICGYATSHKSQLKAHHLIHTGKTFKCSFIGCNFQATKRQNLKYHLLSHSQEKPHQCEICGRNFSLIKNMRRHMLLHTSDSKHACDKCGFNTTRFDKMKEHLLKQHAIGTPPEKRVRVSELVMQNYVHSLEESAGLPEDDEDVNGTVENDQEVADLQEGEVVTLSADGSTVHAIVDAADISSLTGTEQLTITSTDESGQHIEFLEMPGDTIIIRSMDSGNGNQITLPIVTEDGTTIHTATVIEEGDDKDSDTIHQLGYSEIMIPVSQISDLVQHVTYVSQ